MTFEGKRKGRSAMFVAVQSFRLWPAATASGPERQTASPAGASSLKGSGIEVTDRGRNKWGVRCGCLPIVNRATARGSTDDQVRTCAAHRRAEPAPLSA